MTPLEEFESEQKMIHELKELFDLVSPNTLRRNLEDLFFQCITESDDPMLPDQKNLISHFYLLINFLNEAEILHTKMKG